MLHIKRSIWVKFIAMGMACLFFLDTISWAYPVDRSEITTLAAQSMFNSILDAITKKPSERYSYRKRLEKEMVCIIEMALRALDRKNPDIDWGSHLNINAALNTMQHDGRYRKLMEVLDIPRRLEDEKGEYIEILVKTTRPSGRQKEFTIKFRGEKLDDLSDRGKIEIISAEGNTAPAPNTDIEAPKGPYGTGVKRVKVPFKEKNLEARKKKALSFIKIKSAEYCHSELWDNIWNSLVYNGGVAEIGAVLKRKINRVLRSPPVVRKKEVAMEAVKSLATSLALKENSGSVDRALMRDFRIAVLLLLDIFVPGIHEEFKKQDILDGEHFFPGIFDRLSIRGIPAAPAADMAEPQSPKPEGPAQGPKAEFMIPGAAPDMGAAALGALWPFGLVGALPRTPRRRFGEPLIDSLFNRGKRFMQPAIPPEMGGAVAEPASPKPAHGTGTSSDLKASLPSYTEETLYALEQAGGNQAKAAGILNIGLSAVSERKSRIRRVAVKINDNATLKRLLPLPSYTEETLEALKKVGGNQVKAARVLSIIQQTVSQRIIAIRRAAARIGDKATLERLAKALLSLPAYTEATLEALEQSQGKQKEAAGILKISQATVSRRISAIRSIATRIDDKTTLERFNEVLKVSKGAAPGDSVSSRGRQGAAIGAGLTTLSWQAGLCFFAFLFVYEIARQVWYARFYKNLLDSHPKATRIINSFFSSSFHFPRVIEDFIKNHITQPLLNIFSRIRFQSPIVQVRLAGIGRTITVFRMPVELMMSEKSPQKPPGHALGELPASTAVPSEPLGAPEGAHSQPDKLEQVRILLRTLIQKINLFFFGIFSQKKQSREVGLEDLVFERAVIIGEGSFSRVFRVPHKDNGVDYALKLYCKAPPGYSLKSAVELIDYQMRIAREYPQLIKSGIMPKYFTKGSCYFDGDRLSLAPISEKAYPCLLMEYIKGDDLSSLSDLDYHVGTKLVRDALAEGQDQYIIAALYNILRDKLDEAYSIAQAVNACHSAEPHGTFPGGLLIKELKPTNIKVRPDKTVCLVDLESAVPLNYDWVRNPSGVPPVARLVMTSAFSEDKNAFKDKSKAGLILLGQKLDVPWDIYSFGVVLSRMLHEYNITLDDAAEIKEAAVQTDTMRRFLERAEFAKGQFKRSIAGMKEIIKKCTIKDRTKRYRDMGEVIEALKDCIGVVDKEFRGKIPAELPSQEPRGTTSQESIEPKAAAAEPPAPRVAPKATEPLPETAGTNSGPDSKSPLSPSMLPGGEEQPYKPGQYVYEHPYKWFLISAAGLSANLLAAALCLVPAILISSSINLSTPPLIALGGALLYCAGALNAIIFAVNILEAGMAFIRGDVVVKDIPSETDKIKKYLYTASIPHELGHYLMARLFGLNVKFSTIGVDCKDIDVFEVTDYTNMRYAINMMKERGLFPFSSSQPGKFNRVKIGGSNEFVFNVTEKDRYLLEQMVRAWASEKSLDAGIEVTMDNRLINVYKGHDQYAILSYSVGMGENSEIEITIYNQRVEYPYKSQGLMALLQTYIFYLSKSDKVTYWNIEGTDGKVFAKTMEDKGILTDVKYKKTSRLEDHTEVRYAEASINKNVVAQRAKDYPFAAEPPSPQGPKAEFMVPGAALDTGAAALGALWPLGLVGALPRTLRRRFGEPFMDSIFNRGRCFMQPAIPPEMGGSATECEAPKPVNISAEKKEAFFNELGIGEEALAAAILKSPTLAGLNPARVRRAWRDKLGIEKEALAAAILKWPKIAGYNVPNNIKPKLQILKMFNVGKNKIMDFLIRIVDFNSKALEFILEASKASSFEIKDIKTLIRIYRKLNKAVKAKTKVTLAGWFRERITDDINLTVKPILSDIITELQSEETVDEDLWAMIKEAKAIFERQEENAVARGEREEPRKFSPIALFRIDSALYYRARRIGMLRRLHYIKPRLGLRKEDTGRLIQEIMKAEEEFDRREERDVRRGFRDSARPWIRRRLWEINPYLYDFLHNHRPDLLKTCVPAGLPGKGNRHQKLPDNISLVGREVDTEGLDLDNVYSDVKFSKPAKASGIGIFARNEELLAKIEEMISAGVWDRREAFIVKERLGLNPEGARRSLQEIAHALRITRNRVWQIETDAIRKAQFWLRKSQHPVLNAENDGPASGTASEQTTATASAKLAPQKEHGGTSSGNSYGAAIGAGLTGLSWQAGLCFFAFLFVYEIARQVWYARFYKNLLESHSGPARIINSFFSSSFHFPRVIEDFIKDHITQTLLSVVSRIRFQSPIAKARLVDGSVAQFLQMPVVFMSTDSGGEAIKRPATLPVRVKEFSQLDSMPLHGSIMELPISSRIKKRLARGGVKTIDELKNMTLDKIRQIYGIGEKSMTIIKAIKDRLDELADIEMMKKEQLAKEEKKAENKRRRERLKYIRDELGVSRLKFISLLNAAGAASTIEMLGYLRGLTIIPDRVIDSAENLLRHEREIARTRAVQLEAKRQLVSCITAFEQLKEKLKTADFDERRSELTIAQIWVEPDYHTKEIGIHGFMDTIADKIIALDIKPQNHKALRALFELSVRYFSGNINVFRTVLANINNVEELIEFPAYIGSNGFNRESIDEEMRRFREWLRSRRAILPFETGTFSCPSWWPYVPNELAPVTSVGRRKYSKDERVSVGYGGFFEGYLDFIIVGDTMRIGEIHGKIEMHRLIPEVRKKVSGWEKLALEEAIKEAGRRGVKTILFSPPFAQYRALSQWNTSNPDSDIAYRIYSNLPFDSGFRLKIREKIVFSENFRNQLFSHLVWQRDAAPAAVAAEPPAPLASAGAAGETQTPAARRIVDTINGYEEIFPGGNAVGRYIDPEGNPRNCTLSRACYDNDFCRILAADIGNGNAGKKALSIGAGSGVLESRLNEAHGLEVTCIDIISKFMPWDMRGSMAFTLADGEHLPFADNSFDIVILSESIGHMKLDIALAEAFRVLKPGGVIHILTPDPANKLSCDPSLFAALKYSPYDIAQIIHGLKNSGFENGERIKDDNRSAFLGLIYVRAEKAAITIPSEPAPATQSGHATAAVKIRELTVDELGGYSVDLIALEDKMPPAAREDLVILLEEIKRCASQCQHFVILGAFDNGQLIGYTIGMSVSWLIDYFTNKKIAAPAFISRIAKDSKNWFIPRIVVLPEYRKHAVAYRLFQQLSGMARDRNAQRFYAVLLDERLAATLEELGAKRISRWFSLLTSLKGQGGVHLKIPVNLFSAGHTGNTGGQKKYRSKAADPTAGAAEPPATEPAPGASPSSDSEESISVHSDFGRRQLLGLPDKARMLKYIAGNKVIELGCGGGSVTGLIKQRLPDGRVVGIDFEERFLRKARNDYPTCEFYHRNLLEWDDIDSFKGQFSTVILSSALHEIEGEDTRERVLRTAYELLENGGVIIFRDGVKPKNKEEEVEVILKTPYAKEKFELFVKEYRHRKIRFIYTDETHTRIRITSYDLHDLLCKYYFEGELWKRDMSESFGQMNMGEYLDLIGRYFAITHHEKYIAPYLKELWEKDFEVVNKDYPESHTLIVASKPAEPQISKPDGTRTEILQAAAAAEPTSSKPAEGGRTIFKFFSSQKEVVEIYRDGTLKVAIKRPDRDLRDIFEEWLKNEQDPNVKEAINLALAKLPFDTDRQEGVDTKGAAAAEPPATGDYKTNMQAIIKPGDISIEDSKFLLSRASEYLKEKPVDMSIDLSLIPKEDMERNMEIWAYIIALHDKYGFNAHYIFEGKDKKYKASAEETLLAKIKDLSFWKRLDVKAIKARVTDESRPAAMRISIMPLKKLEAMPVIPENTFPVAMSEGQNLDGVPLWDFVGAASLGLAQAACAKLIRENKAGYLETIERKFLPRMQAIYERLFPGKEVKEIVTRQTILEMVNEDPSAVRARINLLIELALPPIVRLALRDLDDYYASLRTLLRAA